MQENISTVIVKLSINDVAYQLGKISSLAGGPSIAILLPHGYRRADPNTDAHSSNNARSD
jgi:hypothetical protein